MKKNINPIPKSYREKKRYIRLESNLDIKNFIKIGFMNFFGVLGMSKLSLMFIDEKTIKINKDMQDIVIFAINYINIKEQISIKIKKISGTLKGLENE